MSAFLTKRAHWLPYLGLFAIAAWFSWDLVFLKRFLNHPEYVDYYPSYRHWFLTELRGGKFPLWNPYWGLGHSSEIEASFPIDIYSLIEIFIGPKYHLILGLQAILILLAAFFSLRTFGFRRALSFLGAVLFLLSPWISYFYLYFIKANSLIGLCLTLAAIHYFFQTPGTKRALLITAATIFTLFGTKVEFWFFHFCFIGLFTCLSALVYRRQINDALKVAGFLLLGISCHLWQIIPLWQILQNSHRLENPPGISSLWHLEMYRGIFQETFQPVFLSEFCRGLISPFGAASAAVTILLFSTRQLRIQSLSSFIIAWLALAYYWVRPLPGDLNEMTVLKQGPWILPFIWGGLLTLAASKVLQSRTAKIAWLSVLFVFIARNQGQIVLSYLFGIQWIPSRDNYLIDFSLTLLALNGLRSLPRRWQTVLSVGIPLILIISLFRDPFYMHPLMADVPSNYPRVTGNQEIQKALESLPERKTQRVYFADPESSADLRMFGTSLITQTRQAHLFSSFISEPFRLWTRYQWFGIKPETKWESYEGEYTPETIANLPPRNTLGMHNNRVYWYALHAMPPPAIHALRLFGVKYVLSKNPLTPFDGFHLRNPVGDYSIGEITGTLPPAFLISDEVSKDSLLKDWAPVIEAGRIQVEGKWLRYQPLPGDGETYQLAINRPGWLIVDALQHPFWNAKLDGKQIESIPAFGLLRAVHIREGKHTLVWECRIPGFAAAVTLSVLAFLLFLAWTLSEVFHPLAAFKLEIEYA